MTNSTIHTKLLEVKSEAVFLANLENQSQEWLDLRATGIGGSDVAAICGISPWTSAFTLWAKKTGKISETFAANEAMEWGTRLESVILNKFEETHPDLRVYRDVGTWSHKDRPWQIANPDAIFGDPEGNYGIIEVKTARYEDDWLHGVPGHYRSQVLWYLQTFGFKTAHVVVLFSGSKYKEFIVELDQFEADVNLELVMQFRDYVSEDKQPDYDGANNTLQTVREMHPQIEDNEIELGDLGMHYFLAAAEFDVAERQLTEMKSRVLGAMGNAKRGLVDGVWRLTRQARSGGTPFLVNKKG